jgi:calcineurin-like phosphoesterase family protein
MLSKIFYISDLHFGHFNIIRYDHRPYKNANEMDRDLINKWNDAVSDEDTVYILGDISWHNEPKTVEIFKQLKGRKILIKGNHDYISNVLAKCFDKIVDYLEINDNGTKVVMSHYPMPFWNGQFRDTVHLYGHVHNSHQWNICESWAEEARQLQAIPMRMYNVGCMMDWMGCTPRTLKEIIDGYNNYKKLRGDKQ